MVKRIPLSPFFHFEVSHSLLSMVATWLAMVFSSGHLLHIDSKADGGLCGFPHLWVVYAHPCLLDHCFD